jgi:hypothetical protein
MSWQQRSLSKQRSIGRAAASGRAALNPGIFRPLIRPRIHGACRRGRPNCFQTEIQKPEFKIQNAKIQNQTAPAFSAYELSTLT